MPEASNHKTKILSKNLFPVVGIGASAGGLEAFKKFIKAIPENSGMAYIIVQHLHPEHTSVLPEILQRETNITVQEVSDNIKIKPNQIYIIPANKILTANDGVLQLSSRHKGEKNMPIDIFFSSLAEVHQNHAIGIILSGTGEDGTAGLRKIKDHGGITFAQDLDSAAFDDMPQNAIKNEVVDFILTPEKMPHQLLELENTLGRLNTDEQPPKEQASEEESFRKILSLIRIRNGADFTYYKQTTIRRRILRRIAILKHEKIADYFLYLQQNKIEQSILFHDLLIPVTGFFRDPKTFEHVHNTVFHELIKNKSTVNPLRIWIAGCSTGEEAYSMGISLYEYLSDKISTIKIQIFATDISDQAIAKARSGIYGKRQLEGISEIRLQQFFTKINGSYQINKIIRDMCVFATHNFLKDPPFAKIDLVSCRNVLIYMEPFLQKKAFTTFHYALNEKSYLLLGKSETTNNSSELFLPADKKEKLYIRKSLTGKFMHVTSLHREEVLKDKDYGLRSNERKKDDFQKNADDILLSKYTPAGVIVNEQFDIVQFRGSTGPYLEPSPGKASLNILKMAREGLSFELRNALHKSKSTGKVFIKQHIPLNYNQVTEQVGIDGIVNQIANIPIGAGDHRKKLVTIEVIPLLDAIDLYFLILFRDEITAGNHAPINGEQDLAYKPVYSKQKRDAPYLLHIKQLEKDLLQSREDMRSITEDQEAANEELQSANEELLSGSEELQSLNEELETSKEELQSTNEELITVNQELFDRNEQLNKARMYAEGIITTIHEPIIVLTADFRIKNANNSFYKSFSLTEDETHGKILFELQNNGWNIPGLKEKLLMVQQKKELFLEWELTYKFPFAGERIICFHAQPITEENERNLILLALDDITLRKEAEKFQSIQNLKLILESMPQITFSATDIDEQKSKERAKDEFITIASHELKTPITTAKALVQLLEHSMQKKNNTDLVYAQKASASVDKLNNLVSELLDVTKIQHGKLGLNISSFNFNDMLRDAIESIQITTRDHKIIKKGVIKTKIKGDQERLKQVITNLLTNAIKYSPGINKVFVDVVLKDRIITVSIKDSGIGIKKKNLNKIFDRYFREEGPAHFQSLGIGLSIAKEIVSRHNGKIWAESEPGKGSTFYFTLPA